MWTIVPEKQRSVQPKHTLPRSARDILLAAPEIDRTRRCSAYTQRLAIQVHQCRGGRDVMHQGIAYFVGI